MSTTENYPDFTGLTFEKVWAMFQESHKKSEMLNEQIAKTDEQMARTDEQMARTAAQMARTDAQMARTDAQMARTDERLAELDEKFAKTEALIAKTDEQIAATNRQIGNLGNRLGEVIEHLVNPGVIPRFNELGYHFDSMTTRFQLLDPKIGKTLTELDIVLENGESVVIVETKVDPSKSDVKYHTRQLQLYREYRNRSIPSDRKNIFGAIAAAVFPPKVQAAALEAGFYVIVQSGDTIKIDVPEGFEPKAF